MASNKGKKRGFASMEKERLQTLVRMGGKKAHALGRAHEWTREEARIAGRRGGSARKRIGNTNEKQILEIFILSRPPAE
jgi:uncharacterized protein